MSGDKATGSCNRFQPNIFNKSKCQNCFKSREVHPLNDSDLEQAKPIYAGWLCLAPEGTDFDNPAQRSRKWQRRFFILYEHGSLTYALDELPSTLPQGTVNMNLCTGVMDAELRTGQRNALCITTASQEVFIRGDSREIVSGWGEQLTAYLSANEQQKKKHSVDSEANQQSISPSSISPSVYQSISPSVYQSISPSDNEKVPSPANMAAAGRSSPGSVTGPAGPDVPLVRTVTRTDPPPGSTKSESFMRVKSDECFVRFCTLQASSLCVYETSYFCFNKMKMKIRRAAKSLPGPPNPPSSPQQRELLVLVAFLGNQPSKTEQFRSGPTGQQPDSRARKAVDKTFRRLNQNAPENDPAPKLRSTGDGSLLSVPTPQRRTRSLDRRTPDSAMAAMTPDLLNFKKGWMMKLDDDEEWKKHWFVLSTASLRFYRDASAEEASDLEGEIDLSKCYSVSEHQVQRNYGFQIHTQKAVFTLSAMTAGIRKNWIQALMKNVNPADAPDVASRRLKNEQKNKNLYGGSDQCLMETMKEMGQNLSGSGSARFGEPDMISGRPDAARLCSPGRRLTCSPAEVRPDVTQDSAASPAPTNDLDQSRAGAEAQLDGSRLGDRAASYLELGDLERRRRRQERRRRYESLLGFSLGRGGPQGGPQGGEGGATRPLSPRSQLKMEERIAECWRQVERTALRPERTVALPAESRDAVEKETLLQGCRTLIKNMQQETQQSSDLRAEGETLQELQEELRRVQEQHQREVAQLKVSVITGLFTMETCHLRVVEELQRQHQQEVERLLLERDRLLEEESAATATAIEAIRKAHRAELQREIQRRSQSENCNGNSQLEEIHRYMREELASCQRELDVLSQQFSLKCLENGHLVQAAEAERKALGQCQQENRALRSRNQELSRHLAAEITRL
uniref:PH domain-containing protein n=1 Tax=Poecilia formosa TaxID=48698 RepID=A0A087XLB9_POEFO